MVDPGDHYAEWFDAGSVELLPPPPGAFERVEQAARRRRRNKAIAAGAACAIVAVGVVGGAALVVGGLPGVPPAEPAASAVVTPSPTETPTQVTSPPAPPATSTGSATERCHSADLRVTTTPVPGSGAAGSSGVWLVFTNISNRTCTMYGFPGVSFVVGPSGQQVNDPATRTSAQPGVITLAPQANASATLRLASPDNYGPECQKVQVGGFRVYPPDETAAVFVPDPRTACSGKGIGVPEIAPVQR